MMIDRFNQVRAYTEQLCNPLEIEDYVPQAIVDVSPPKWHLAHTTWFFETFILKAHQPDYKEFHPRYSFLFNSYYESVGDRVLRDRRGHMSRPTVQDVYAYRSHVNEAMNRFAESIGFEGLKDTLELGLQHEQQHQELLITDLKYMLAHNPLFPAYDPENDWERNFSAPHGAMVDLPEGLYDIGYTGSGFSFDNEHGRHKVYLEGTRIHKDYVTNAEYLAFIKDGGYSDFRHWLSEAWGSVQTEVWKAPLYWHEIDGAWHQYRLDGLHPIEPQAPVHHLSYFEAEAYATWAGKRLLTEFEHEVVADQLNTGKLWEWTGSAYLPYPRFETAPGAIGEYNGKFMINQMVLRGGSLASPSGHVDRPTYRNFFHPHLRWQFNGIRLAEK
jgi:ergothioneine biosynthesis protein EgtB